MPDWNYQTLIKPVLQIFSDATAEKIALRGIQALGSNPIGRISIDLMGHMDPPESLSFKIGETSFSSRVFLSAEVDPQGLGAKAFAKFGFGALEFSYSETLKFQNQNNLRIPILPIIELSDIDTDSFSILVEHIKVFRLSQIATDSIFSMNKDEQIIFLKKLRSISSQKQIEWIFSFSTHSGSDQILSFFPFFQSVHFAWIHLTSTNSVKEVAQFAKELQPLKYFKIMAQAKVTSPFEYEQLRGVGVEVILLDKAIFNAGPGLPKRLNLAEEARSSPISLDLNTSATRLSWFWAFLLGLGMFFGGWIVLVVARTNVLFSYDESISGISKEKILEFKTFAFHVTRSRHFSRGNVEHRDILL